MSPIAHENVVHTQSPLDRIPKKKESRGSIDAFTCTNIRHLLFFWFKKKKKLWMHAHSRTYIFIIDLHLYMYSTKGKKSIYESYVHTYV